MWNNGKWYKLDLLLRVPEFSVAFAKRRPFYKPIHSDGEVNFCRLDESWSAVRVSCSRVSVRSSATFSECKGIPVPRIEETSHGLQHKSDFVASQQTLGEKSC